jgi:hypothetical protein
MRPPVIERTLVTEFPLMPRFEMDPNYAKIQFFILESNNVQAKVTLRKDDIKRLRLMVDDFIRIRMIPEQSGSEAVVSASDRAAVVKANVVAVSIYSRGRSSEYQEMIGKKTSEVLSEAHDFSPFTQVSVNLRYPDTDSHDIFEMKKEDLARLNITAGDTVFLELSKVTDSSG